MLYESFNQVSKKIKTLKKQEEAYKILESKILTSPQLKSYFEAITILQENAGKVKTSKRYNEIKEEIKAKNIDFSEVKKQSNSLLEYFNVSKINKESKFDKAIETLNFKEILLNEAAIIRKSIFKGLLNEDINNELEIKKQFQIIKFIANKKKEMVMGSLRGLLEERYTNYNSFIKKLYRLREAVEDMEDDGKEYSEAIADLPHIKKIKITASDKVNPGKIIISFSIPIYPIGTTRSQAITSSLNVGNKLNRLERTFVNSTIYQKDRTNYFDPVGTIWDVSLRQQVNPNQKIAASVSVYLNTKLDSGLTLADYKKVVQSMLSEFSANLPQFMGDLAVNLTPEGQKNKYQGDVNRALIMKHLNGKDSAESERIDDFGGYF